MSSTQGHTNINTVHTTLDISVLLGEINRIADESYSKGFECGYDVGMKGKADGAKEFAEWLISHSMLCDSLGQDISDCYDGDCNKAIEDVLAEWQKGAEK